MVDQTEEVEVGRIREEVAGCCWWEAAEEGCLRIVAREQKGQHHSVQEEQQGREARPFLPVDKQHCSLEHCTQDIHLVQRLQGKLEPLVAKEQRRVLVGHCSHFDHHSRNRLCPPLHVHDLLPKVQRLQKEQSHEIRNLHGRCRVVAREQLHQ